MAHHTAPGIFKVADFRERNLRNCELFRYRCPVREIDELQHVNSKYSPEFQIGGVAWRIHLQHRLEPQSQQVYLAIHLQCMNQQPTGTFAHFKLTVANYTPERAKHKIFHCNFKKSGSAWGLHHFVPLDELLHVDNGFIDYGIEEMPLEFPEFDTSRVAAGVGGSVGGASGSRGLGGGGGNGATPACIVIDVLVRVIEPDRDGTYQLGNLPRGDYGPRFGTVGSVGRSPATAGGVGRTSLGSSDPNATAALPNSALQFPYDETLCDMAFRIEGSQTIRAHRCVIWARMPKLFPPSGLAEGGVIDLPVTFDVFKALLTFVYREEPPEKGTLRVESLLDLYLLAMDHEFTALGEHCLRNVEPLLTYENILSVVTTRFNPNDDILNALYLQILTAGYSRLIEEPLFEHVPGQIHRHLSLIQCRKEPVPTVQFPKSKVTLSSQLGSLAESGAYADFDLKLANGMILRTHKFILASRSLVFNQVFYQRAGASASSATAPSYDTPEFTFTPRAWQRFATAVYRGALDMKDIAAEDIAIVWKMTDPMQLDKSLRRDTKNCINESNALRLLVYAEKHNIPSLKEGSLQRVCATFGERARADPAAWDIIAELSHQSLLNLFRTVVENRAY